MKKLLALLLCVIMVAGMMAACETVGEAPAAEGEKKLDYPKKTVEIIIPYAAGGGTDVMVRALCAELPFTTMVTNIAGASASIGTMEALHRDPDGYTILAHLPESMSCYVMNGTYTEPVDDLFVPICAPVIDPMCMVIGSNNGKFANLEELVAYATEHPGEVKWCATGTKSQNHMISAQTWTALGIDVTYVPFDSGSKSRAALLGGNADIFVTQISEVAAYVQSGDMIPIMTYDANRSSILPDTPTAEELGYEGLISVSHRGFLAVPGTPQEIIDFFADAVKTVCDNPEFQQKMRDLGYDPVYSGTEEIKEYQANIKASFAEASKLVG